MKILNSSDYIIYDKYYLKSFWSVTLKILRWDNEIFLFISFPSLAFLFLVTKNCSTWLLGSKTCDIFYYFLIQFSHLINLQLQLTRISKRTTLGILCLLEKYASPLHKIGIIDCSLISLTPQSIAVFFLTHCTEHGFYTVGLFCTAIQFFTDSTKHFGWSTRMPSLDY